MDLTANTPRDIDLHLADLQNLADRVAFQRRKHSQLPAPNPATLARYDDEADYYRTLIDQVRDEYTRRGGWTRVYVVIGGHVHSTTGCRNGYYATTSWGWLPEWSGMDEADIVAAAGDRACTWCYPTAPADTRQRPSQIEHPDETVQRQKREKRDAEREAKAAAARAKQVIDPATGEQVRDRNNDVLKTERTVQIAAVDSIWWGNLALERGNQARYEHWIADARRLTAALAAKRGTDTETLFTELADKARKRK